MLIMKHSLFFHYIPRYTLLFTLSWGYLLFFSACTSKPSVKALKVESEKMFKIHFDVEKYQLKNGLTVLLHQDMNAPLINYQTWYRVGGKDDPQGQSGIAHLFEHLTFRETNKRDGKDFLKEVESKGIGYNAYTSFDETVYYFNLPPKELEFIAELEAERMVDIVINQKNLKLEQDIVKEERLMRVENNPQSIWIDLFKTIFKRSQYQYPVIGYKKDIEDVTVKNCLDFYNKFYSPNNAILVIAGPININQTKKIVEKYYGHLKKEKLPPANYPKEPRQYEPRFKKLKRPVHAPSVTVAYSTVSAESKDQYALDILSFILGGGKASRLHQLLVESKLALSASAFSYILETEGVMIVSASLHPETSLRKVEDIILDEIQKIVTNNISEEELLRARTNIVKAHVDSLKTMSGKGSLLGTYERSYGRYDRLFEELGYYNKVTRKDIQMVAQNYLKAHNTIHLEKEK